jgi:aspartate carbamoyltransferase catalytic subunit
MALRIQHERQAGDMLPSREEYAHFYCITPERMRLAAAGAMVMHPGPINRGVELSSEVADSVQSRILRQVANGVAVRMAVLSMAAG